MIPKSTVYNAPYPKSYGNEFTLFDHGEGCYIFDVEGKTYLVVGCLCQVFPAVAKGVHRNAGAQVQILLSFHIKYIPIAA